MIKMFLFTSLILFLVSCGDQKIDTTKARQEMEAREIKRVSEGEIVEKALNLGNEITEGISLLNTDGEGYTLPKTMEKQAQVRFIAFSDLQNFQGKGKRFQIYDAYTYNAENDIDAQAGVQILEGDTTLLYTKPAFFQEQVVGILSIDFKRKDIVLSIEK